MNRKWRYILPQFMFLKLESWNINIIHCMYQVFKCLDPCSKYLFYQKRNIIEVCTELYWYILNLLVGVLYYSCHFIGSNIARFLQRSNGQHRGQRGQINIDRFLGSIWPGWDLQNRVFSYRHRVDQRESFMLPLWQRWIRKSKSITSNL